MKLCNIDTPIQKGNIAAKILDHLTTPTTNLSPRNLTRTYQDSHLGTQLD